MTKELEKIFISLAEAAQYSAVYSQDYLSLRARQGKLKAVKFGRNWLTKKEWVDAYLASNNKDNGRKGPAVISGSPVVKHQPLDFISLSMAAKYSAVYSQDYLSLRARQGKLKAVKFGRNWLTKKEWVDEYLASNGNGAGQLKQRAQCAPTAPAEEKEKAGAERPVLQPIAQPLTPPPIESAPFKQPIIVFCSSLKNKLIAGARCLASAPALFIKNVFRLFIKTEEAAGQRAAGFLQGLGRLIISPRLAPRLLILAVFLFCFLGGLLLFRAGPLQFAVEPLQIVAGDFREKGPQVFSQDVGSISSFVEASYNRAVFSAKRFPLTLQYGALGIVRSIYSDAPRYTKEAIAFLQEKAGPAWQNTGGAFLGYISSLSSRFVTAVNLCKRQLARTGQSVARRLWEGAQNLRSLLSFTWPKSSREKQAASSFSERLMALPGHFKYYVFKDSKFLYQKTAQRTGRFAESLQAIADSLLFKSAELKDGAVQKSRSAAADTVSGFSLLKNRFNYAAQTIFSKAGGLVSFLTKGAERIEQNLAYSFSAVKKSISGFFQKTGSAFKALAGYVRDLPGAIAGLFSKEKELELNQPLADAEPPALTQPDKGLIVVPSTDDNEKALEEIELSFSDEVEVIPQDENSGIIVPIFRERRGEDYLYLMVPVKE